MLKHLLSAAVSCALLACSSAYADRAAPGRPIAQVPQAGPYGVEILGDHLGQLDTYRANGRTYVLGERGERYVIRVTNPTPERVEAVVTVDGLDVIDGEPGDLRKRGYIVPAYGELRVEGFRTSTRDVATFRFSSVGESYAGRKGKARNVGVIAVAFFAERAQPQIIEGTDDDVGTDDERPPLPRPPRRSEVEIMSSPSADGPARAGGVARAPARPSPPAPPRANVTPTKRQRSGLGTEFGEQRGSAVSFTSFDRASARPIAISELRYNDADGLAALGLPVRQPSPDELELRESADPFPGERGFAQPPPYRR